MADRRYEFTIKMKGETGGKTNPIAGSSKTESDTETAKSGGMLTKDQAKVFAKGMVAYGMTKSFATQIINHEVSMVEMRTGSKELQQRASFNMQVAQQGLGIAESMATGALVGGLPGAIVGTIIGFARTAINYNQNVNRINTARAVENVGLGMNYVRAGANGSRRG